MQFQQGPLSVWSLSLESNLIQFSHVCCNINHEMKGETGQLESVITENAYQ